MAGENILVVEDQRSAAGALQMRLRGLGYDVSAVAKDGIEAIEKASELKPDLILMDVRLGAGIDGIEAARQIRSKLNIPVVYLSAHIDQKLLDRARATCPAGFINKPFTTKDLLIAIDFALRGGQDRTGGEANTAIAPSSTTETDADGLVSTDHEGRISFADRAAERIIGLARRSLIDRPLAELLSSLYELPAERAADLITSVLSTHREERLARVQVVRTGPSRQQEDLLTPLFDTRGQCYGVALKLFSSGGQSGQHTGGNALSNALIQALDTLPHGVICLNAELRVDHMNRAAREILGRNRGMECRNGIFGIQDRALDARLREFVRLAIHDGQAGAGAMFVRAPMSGEHVELLVASVPGNGGGSQEARANLFLFDSNAKSNASHDLLTGLYGLTHTEAKLVQLMSNGLTLDEAGHELAISVHTARTHLKHVFHKTGVNRQAELIHRIGSGPASLLLKIAPTDTRK